MLCQFEPAVFARVMCWLFLMIAPGSPGVVQAEADVQLESEKSSLAHASTKLRLSASAGTARFMGYVIEKVNEAFRRAGVSVEMANFPSIRGVDMAAAGELDGVYMRLISSEKFHPTLKRIDVPIYRGDAWIWMQGDRECPKSESDLRALTTASVLGYLAYDEVPEISDSPRVNVRSMEQAFKVLLAGRIDFLTAYGFAGGFYQQYLGVSLKRCFEQPIAVFDYYTVIHEKHEALIPQLEIRFREVFEEPVEPRI